MADKEVDELGSDLARGEFDLRPGRSSTQPKPVKLWVIAGSIIALVLAVLIGVWSWAINRITEPLSPAPAVSVKGDEMLENRPSVDSGMERKKEEVLKKKAEEDNRARLAEEAKKKEQEEKPQSALPGSSKAGQPRNKQPDPTANDALQRKLGSGVVVQPNLPNRASNEGSGDSGSQSGPNEQRPYSLASDNAEDASSQLQVSAGSASRGNLNDLSGPTFAPSRAYLAPKGKYLLRHGTYGRCALYTEIITEQPGAVDCRLVEPLYSADGSTVIADAGARIDGVQTVEMRPGQRMVFTNWTDIETTAGVRAHIASYGAGPLGASGTKAYVDNHLLDRFGGAMMLTLFKDSLAAATANRQSNNSGYTFNNTEQNVEGMAEKALEYSINIPPTGVIPAATVVTVIITRDIDFSPVYVNRPRG